MEAVISAISGSPEDMICNQERRGSSQGVKQMRGEVMDVI